MKTIFSSLLIFVLLFIIGCESSYFGLLGSKEIEKTLSKTFEYPYYEIKDLENKGITINLISEDLHFDFHSEGEIGRIIDRSLFTNTKEPKNRLIAEIWINGPLVDILNSELLNLEKSNLEKLNSKTQIWSNLEKKPEESKQKLEELGNDPNQRELQGNFIVRIRKATPVKVEPDDPFALEYNIKSETSDELLITIKQIQVK